MRLRIFVAAAALLASSLAARASDVDVTLYASGQFTSGSTLSGSVSFDQTTGTLLGGDLVVSGPDNLTFSTSPDSLCRFPIVGDCTIQLAETGGAAIDLGVVGTTFVGYDGGVLGSVTAKANGITSVINLANGGLDDLDVGSLSPVAPTPEPASFLLLGTGLLGVVGVARKRAA